MPKFGDRKPARPEPEREQRDERLFARVSTYTGQPQTASLAEINLTPDFAQLGEHVGAVLESAKDAADQIKRQAEEAAETIRAQAEHESSSVLDNARKQARRLEEEAAQLEESSREQSTQDPAGGRGVRKRSS